MLDHDAEFGKNLLDAFTRAVADVNRTAASTTSCKRGASGFSSQIARMTCAKFLAAPIRSRKVSAEHLSATV